MFEAKMVAGWGDMDFNAHMGNTAYLNKAGDARMMFFAENGFSVGAFREQQFGPVVMKDEIHYFKEINLLEEFTVTLSLAGMSDDGSRFLLENRFVRAGDKLAAAVKSAGGWLDLSERKLTTPPDLLLDAMRSLHRTDDFQQLPSSVR